MTFNLILIVKVREPQEDVPCNSVYECIHICDSTYQQKMLTYYNTELFIKKKNCNRYCYTQWA